MIASNFSLLFPREGHSLIFCSYSRGEVEVYQFLQLGATVLAAPTGSVLGWDPSLISAPAGKVEDWSDCLGQSFPVP